MAPYCHFVHSLETLDMGCKPTSIVSYHVVSQISFLIARHIHIHAYDFLSLLQTLQSTEVHYQWIAMRRLESF